MIPRRRDRRPDAPVMPIAGTWYGTTLWVYDPALDAWRIFWIDPATSFFCQGSARRWARTLCRKARWHRVRAHAGASRRSRRARSTGSANSRPMTARPGACWWK
jgi:hypothetical protein